MRSRSLAVLCSLVAWPLLAQVPATPPPPEPTGGRVAGRLLDADSGAGVAGKVFVRRLESSAAELERRARGEHLPSPAAEIETAKDGRFSLRLPDREGFFVLEGWAERHERAFIAEFCDGATVDRRLSATRLAAGETVTGRIVDAAGQAIAGAVVTLESVNVGMRRIARPTLYARSGEDGRFSLAGAPTVGGQLRVWASGRVFEQRKGVRGGSLGDLRLATAAPLRGQVLEAGRERAVAGALVAVGKFGEVVTSGDDGRFELTSVPATEFQLTVRAAGRARRDLTLRAAAEPIEIRLAPAAELDLVVSEKGSGAVVARALGRLDDDERAFADARGRIVFAGLAPGAIAAAVQAAGFLEGETGELQLVAGASRRRALALERAASLAGVVVADDGTPIADATIAATELSGLAGNRMMRRMGVRVEAAIEATSADDGSFRLEPLRPIALELAVGKDGFANKEQSVARLRSGENRTGVKLVLERGGLAIGRVTNREDEALAGVTIEARPASAMPFRMPLSEQEPLARGSTDPDGRFVLRGLPFGRVEIVAIRPGFVASEPHTVEIRREAPADVGALQLLPGAALRGRVIEKNGAPVAGAHLMAGLAPFGFGLESSTAGDGYFQFDDLDPARDYQVNVMASGRGRVTRDGLRPGTEPVEIELPDSRRISGRVKERGTDVPIAKFTLTWRKSMRAGGGGMGFMMTFAGEGQPFENDLGHFDLDGVDRGEVDLTVVAAGYRERTVRVAEESAEPVEIDVEKGLAVSGRVLGPDRRPVAGASVESSGDGDGAMGMGGMRRMMREAQGGGTLTDGEGSFRIEGLAAGRVVISAEADGLAAGSKEIQLEADVEGVELQLGRGARVAGSVRTATGAPGAGAEVTLGQNLGMPMPWGDSPPEVADDNGQFQFLGVTAGSYSLQATLGSGASSGAAAVTVPAEGDPAPVELVIEAGARIEGQISGLPPERWSKVRIFGFGPTGELSGTIDAASGTFVVEHVPNGTIHLSATDMAEMFGGRSVQKTIEVVGGQSITGVEMAFPEGASLSGRITRAEASVAGALVIVSDRAGGAGSTATSDRDGAYQVDGLADGTHGLDVVHMESGARLHREVEIRGDTSVDIELPSGRVAGRVVDAGSREPIVEAAIALTPKEGDPWRLRQAASDERGDFLFVDVADGDFTLSASASGYATGSRELSVISGSTPAVEIELQREAQLRLFVADARTGASPNRLDVPRVGGDRLLGSQALESADGWFEVLGLASGAAALVVLAPGAAPVTLPSAAAPGEARITVSGGGFVELSDAGSARLLRPDGAVEWQVGERFGATAERRLHPPLTRLGPIAPGSYRLEVRGETPRSYDIVVREGETTKP